MRELKSEEPRGVGMFDDGNAESDASVELVVSWGEETHSPIQYQSFRTGSVSMRMTTAPGETVEELHAKMLDKLRRLARLQFEAARDTFFENVKDAASRVVRR